MSSATKKTTNTTKTTKSWAELREQVSARPGSEERIAQHRQAALAEIGLYQLRQATKTSQAALAARLDVTQPAISQLEHSDDVRVSTLRDYIEALGGQLELVAVLDDGSRIPIRIGGPDIDEK